MKKQKLKLEDLKVKSFVTSMEKQQKQTIDGGITPAITISLTIASAASILTVGSFPDDDTVYNCQAYTFANNCTKGCENIVP